MKPSIEIKLKKMSLRCDELRTLLALPTAADDMNQYRALSKEYAQVEPLAEAFTQYQTYLSEIAEANALLDEADESMQQLAKEELQSLQEKIEKLEADLLLALIPQDPYDQNNIFLEIRAGAGGDEASIFSGDLARMYTRYAQAAGWKVEEVSEHVGEHGGYKEIILRIVGEGAYSYFKFESGVHRVQRVPLTEAQGRVHTSTCTIAVLPELEEIEEIDIAPQDLRIDTFRSQGAGGQHVQKTDSAIRITHLPTGTVVECQDERSQHKNRARAMSLLKARILAAEREKQQKARAETRRNLVGTGDRSERIRTYNFPQGRLTDHRINLTLYQLTNIMEGELNPVIDALRQEYHADLIASLAET